MARSQHFGSLNATEFEDFTSQLLSTLELVNVDWRKGTPAATSPADSGRDITCQEVRKDVDGAVHLETWFVDCKHFRRAVPATELQNLLAWAEAESPHVVLFAVSGYLSNPAKDYLDRYRKTRRPAFKIKVWERPQLEKLSRRRVSLLRKFNLTDEPIKSVKAIVAAEQEHFDRVWYDRHQGWAAMVKAGHAKPSRELWRTARAAARRLEKKYGKKNLGPYSDFEWGMINGKLSTLRWVLGDEWDMLDS